MIGKWLVLALTVKLVTFLCIYTPLTNGTMLRTVYVNTKHKFFSQGLLLAVLVSEVGIMLSFIGLQPFTPCFSCTKGSGSSLVMGRNHVQILSAIAN